MPPPSSQYRRPVAQMLAARIAEPPQSMQILAGPRQVGKTTLVHQVLGDRPAASYHFAAADNPETTDAMAFNDAAHTASNSLTAEGWLQQHWQHAESRSLAWDNAGSIAQNLPFVLVLDEIQLVPQWSTHIKGLWDAARARGARMHVVLLGSAPLLVQQGLKESLTGRYELIRVTHWSFSEMNDAFDYTLDQYIYFGGYPGAARLIREEARWRAYVRDALVEPSIEKDVFAMARVDKPAMLRRLFELGCEYSGQILSLDNVSRTLGQGHTLTLAEHLRLLGEAGLLTGLQKYAAQTLRKRKSPPKFQVKNNALMTGLGAYNFDDALADRSHWGRLAESTVGAHLINTADVDTQVHYWREGDLEVDFVVERRGKLAAIEVKTSASTKRHAGLDEFCRRHPDARRWLVGAEELPIGEFLRQDTAHWAR